MGEVTTHTEGRVVTHRSDDNTVDVVQLPNRDAAVQAASPAAPAPAKKTPAAAAPPPKPAAVKASTKQKAARIKKAKKR